jgi:hypothetical protein
MTARIRQHERPPSRSGIEADVSPPLERAISARDLDLDALDAPIA